MGPHHIHDHSRSERKNQSCQGLLIANITSTPLEVFFVTTYLIALVLDDKKSL
jgi:hypothetical protein